MTPMPRAADFATAEEFIVADAQWLRDQGSDVGEHRSETARTHWENQRKASLRRAGVRIPGDLSRMTHGRYL